MKREKQVNDKTVHGKWAASFVVLLGLLFVSVADAQQWKYVYGALGNEVGFNRVKPVTGTCASTTPSGGGSAYNGYIAVGTSFTRDPNGDIYVVRTDNNGATAWERTYDINNNNLADAGWGLVEVSDGSGFVITGFTEVTSGDYDVFLMKINCQGNILWTQTYGTVVGNEYGLDVIETTTGNPNNFPKPTAAGDFVVCGFMEYIPAGQQVLNRDAYLLRTMNTGAIIWDAQYDNPTGVTGIFDMERFYALTEATPVGTAPTGDIIAVGEWVGVNGGGMDGYVLRANGDNGSLGGTAYQRAATFGGCVYIFEDIADPCIPNTDCYHDFDNCYDAEQFFSVIELQNPGLTDVSGQPDVVVVGVTYSPGHGEIYAVRIDGGDPCTQDVENTIGQGFTGICSPDVYTELAQCVREVTWEMGGDEVSQYDLALTGRTDQGSGNVCAKDDDAFLLTIDPNTLAPVTGGIAVLYGQTGQSLNEDGYSLDPVQAVNSRTEGFIICGTNHSDPVGAGDPGDLYLIKTNTAGSASATGQCENVFDVDKIDYGWTPFCRTPTSSAWSFDASRNTVRYSGLNDDEICTGAGGKSVSSTIPSHRLNAWRLKVEATPNPVLSGKSTTLDVTGVSGQEIEIRVFDEIGRIIKRFSTVMVGTQVEVVTTGLLSGLYTVSVWDGKNMGSTMMQVVE
ncbi:MAG: T9SS type A sorting domain-containing protein [Candidatus Kapaibacterium sp.]